MSLGRTSDKRNGCRQDFGNAVAFEPGTVHKLVCELLSLGPGISRVERTSRSDIWCNGGAQVLLHLEGTVAGFCARPLASENLQAT